MAGALLAFWLGWAGGARAQTTVLSEGFEGAFPSVNGWSIGDGVTNAGLVYWNDVNNAFGGVSARTGNWKGYCAGTGNAGTVDAPRYTNYMDAYMSNTLTLAAYTGANLTFWYRMPSIETGYDSANVYINTNKIWTSDVPATNWTQVCLSLKSAAGTNVGLRFQFSADYIYSYEGWYLDDIKVTASKTAFVDALQYLVVTNGSDYLRDSYGDAIQAYTEYRTENFSGVATNHATSLSYRLINATTGLPHPIYNSGGVTNSGYSFNTNVTAYLLPGTNTVVTVQPDLIPAARLDQFTSYYVECRLMSNTTVLGTLTDAPRAYYHFTNLVAGDASLNVLARMTNLAWSGVYAVQSVPGQDTFRATVGYELRRWDGVPGATVLNSVPVVFSYTLRDGAGNYVPLVASNEVDYPTVANHGSFTILGTTLYFVTAVAESRELNIKPAVQLNSVSNTYYLTVTISHTNNTASGERIVANTRSTTTNRLVHPTGHIWFGAIDTRFTSQLSDPVYASTSAGYCTVWMNPDSASGYVVGNTSHTYGDGSWLPARVYPDGHAELAAGSVVLNAPSPDADAIAKISYRRGPVTLDSGGGWCDLTLYLPTGLSYRTNNTVRPITFHKVPFSHVDLTGTLDPKVSYMIWAPGVPVFVNEESKPVWLETDSLYWNITAGTIDVAAMGSEATYVRAEQYAWLAAQSNAMVKARMAVKRSNDRYYEFVAGVKSGLSRVSGDSKGNALLYTTLAFKNGSFLAHFPYDTRIGWGSDGQAVIDADRIVGGSLDGADKLFVPYSRACQGCPASAAGGYGQPELAPTNNLVFTPDGGLAAGGQMTDTVDLAWGYIAPDVYAQIARGFREGAFLMPGVSIRGDQNLLKPAHGPMSILFTGVAVSNLTVIERPGSSLYKNGFADYAGMNFRCLRDRDFPAKSTIAGYTTPYWDLTGRSKYYVRFAGVSGIHESVPGSFPKNLTLYGYKFTFSSYGLSYLDSENKDSRTDGTVYLPYPSDFVQGLDNMKFNCLGAPESADVPRGDGFKLLSYWQADFETRSIQFESNNGCDPTDGTLVLGVDAYASHVKTNLYGLLGIKPNGNFVTAADGLTTINSRLKLPNNFAIEGANKSTYMFIPTLDAYFNNWETAPPEGTTPTGWMNIIGTVDIPFFEDMRLHLQTSCHTNGAVASNATIHLAGGWTREGSGFDNHGWDDGAGHNFFNTTTFDDKNAGWPGGGIPIDKYRNNPDADQYHPRAQRKWLDVVPLDYPLAWDSLLRQFKSSHAITVDLLVLNVEHQLTYMDGTQAVLDFGIQYDGLPKISVANMVFNAIDEQTGVAKALIDGASQPVFDALSSGLDQMNKLLDTEMRSVMSGVFDNTIDPVITELYHALHTDWNGMSAAQRLDFVRQVRVQGTNYLMGKVGGYAGNLNATLQNLATTVGGANNLISQVREYLRNATNAINAVTETVSIGTNGLPLEHIADGLLSKVGNQYPVASGLVGELVRNIAAEFLDAVVGDALNELLAQVDPSLQQVRTVLNQVRDEIMRADAQLGSTGNFTAEFQQIFQNNVTALSNVTSSVMGSMATYFGQLDYSIDDPFVHYSEAEVKQFIRQKIEDQFFGSVVTAEIQKTLRNRLYELDAAMRTGIDTVFQQFNDAMRSLIGQYLSELDNSINGMLGDIGSSMGAGKINGHAVINHDSLKLLRLDGHFQWKAPDAMEFNAFLEIKELSSDGTPSGCSSASGTTMEVTLGANDVDCGWLASDLKATVVTKFTFDDGVLVNLAGSVDLKGEISFEAFKLYDLAAAIAFGKYENYLALRGGVKFNSYDFSGAIFFGRTCTLDPIKLIDPDVADVIGAPPFTGAYCYAQGWIPVSEAVLGIPASCFFRISAGIGAGAFYFIEGPTYGGKMFLGVEGEALCIVSISAEIMMIGVKHGDDLQFKGRGSFEADIGPCPFCISWSTSVDLSYKNKKWHID